MRYLMLVYVFNKLRCAINFFISFVHRTIQINEICFVLFHQKLLLSFLTKCCYRYIFIIQKLYYLIDKLLIIIKCFIKKWFQLNRIKFIIKMNELLSDINSLVNIILSIFRNYIF